MKKPAVLLLIALLLSFSCKENKQRIIVERIISEWIGKEIYFSADLQCNLLGKDTCFTLCSELLNTEYKILLYVDSSGCTNCRLRLYEWKNKIAETDSLFDRDKVGYLFFYHPKEKNEMNHFLKRDRFDYPVFIDNNNIINTINHFPSQPELQCFLLDKNNRVVMVGNPTLNPKIWELYKTCISGNKQTTQPLTTIRLDKTVYNYGTIRKDSKNEVVFFIENIGEHPLVIGHISTSCGCTNVLWDKQPIEKGKSTKITVEISPDEIGYFNKTIDVFGNIESSPVKFSITGVVIE